MFSGVHATFGPDRSARWSAAELVRLNGDLLVAPSHRIERALADLTHASQPGQEIEISCAGLEFDGHASAVHVPELHDNIWRQHEQVVHESLDAFRFSIGEARLDDDILSFNAA